MALLAAQGEEHHLVHCLGCPGLIIPGQQPVKKLSTGLRPPQRPQSANAYLRLTGNPYNPSHSWRLLVSAL